MSKRPVEDIYEESASKKPKTYEHVNKHTLDSDEEDSDVDESRYNVLDEEEIQGEEDGVSGMDGDVKITPFNMKEELEEGHFDGDGHFQWKKQKEIKDHWLDNLDWVKIQKFNDDRKQKLAEDGAPETSAGGGGLADSSSESEDEGNDESLKKFDVIAAYRRILELMKPKETVQRALQRLGKATAKISSIERFRRKKAGIVDENAALVTELTELCNKILTKMGNMNVYEETFEEISAKFASKLKGGGGFSLSKTDKSIDVGDALDMYADDFDSKEQKQMTSGDSGADGESSKQDQTTDLGVDDSKITWEFKWKLDDTECQGPYTTDQMYKWSLDGYFKDGVFVKKCGIESQFNSSNRIDFELYL
ncbi:CD2 antigen cytoplasmic tail-binding protein 2 homolog [Sitodiplosis mosellana]|uniref:CD2 antigen cytoplasmic tail-binding protein 2 homolog n=1 Tax=Sitodiplosis mosellana TaxID=263140 RepID=UPI002444179E|nr:CD2 antigen cytoplasmic tail-binding protein 2 homolog [Sitodiplosis mosellana]